MVLTFANRMLCFIVNMSTKEKINMPHVPVKMWRKFPLCQAQCPFDRECANHISAGDYRTESGLTSDLHRVGKHWECSQCPTLNLGAILIDKSPIVGFHYPPDFEKWWKVTQASKYTQVTLALQNAFKETAYGGWVAGKNFQSI